MMVVQRFLKKSEQQLRFLIAGGINTVFGLAFFPLLLMFAPFLYRNYMLGLVISQVICTIIAFFNYKLFVFHINNGNIYAEFAKFMPFYILNYLINIAALPALVKWVGLSPIVAQIGFTIALMVGSYFWHSRITFRPSAGRW